MRRNLMRKRLDGHLDSAMMVLELKEYIDCVMYENKRKMHKSAINVTQMPNK